MTALHCAAFIVHDNSMVFASKKDKKAKEKAMSSLWEKKEKIVEFMVSELLIISPFCEAKALLWLHKMD